MVVPAAAAGDDLAERLLAHCGGRLSAHKIPEQVRVVDDLDHMRRHGSEARGNR
jgi:hypothetical protein